MTAIAHRLRLRIGHRLFLLGLLAIVPLMVVVWASYDGISRGRAAAQAADARQLDIRMLVDAELDLANLSTLVSRRLNYEVFPARFKKTAQRILASLAPKIDAVAATASRGDAKSAAAGLGDLFVAATTVIVKIETDPTVDDEQKFIAVGDGIMANLAVLRQAFEKDYAQAAALREASLAAAVSRPVWIGGGTVVLLILAVVLLAGSILRPLRRLTAAMRRLATGDFDVVLPGLARADEVGEMAQAVETFKVKAAEKVQHDAAQKQAAETAAATARKAEMDALADQFQSAVGHIIETVSSAARELEASADTLAHTAATTQRLSGSVATASEQASANVQSVAAAATELNRSVNEIGRHVEESSRIASQAVQQAQMTDGRISDLSQAAARIGDVVKLISAVAEQTNLLALNATIEAARAGDAGRGFAVVASEVKALAGQTAKATEEISTQIAGMQTATRESVGAIKEIGGTIGRVAEIASSIAAAVEEQGATTGEIARNVREAAKGATDVAANITDVNRGAGETGLASARMLASARSLAKESGLLKNEVDRFLATVRAA